MTILVLLVFGVLALIFLSGVIALGGLLSRVLHAAAPPAPPDPQLAELLKQDDSDTR